MEPSTSTDRIVVGVDGSPPSLDALRQAARIAAALQAPLEAITTWEFQAPVEYYAASNWSPEENARTILDTAIAEAFGDTPPPGLTSQILHGAPARVLIEQSEGAGMLVIGSRGHGGFVGMLIGSVSAACAAHARCPVLVVHSPRRH